MLMTGARRAVKVPFLDLGPVHEPLKAADPRRHRGADRHARRSRTAPPCAGSRRRSRAFCGTRECVGVASGLDALRLGLLRRGLEPGDEVIVPAHTFVATFEAVTQAGGVPVPVDVGEDDYNLDSRRVEAARRPRDRAFVLPVHLYGQMADMRRAARGRRPRTGSTIVEDACQAHGAERDGLRAGDGGLRGRLQLLPGQEPRRDGRRGRARHRRRPTLAGARARAARARPAGEVRARPRGLHGPARHDPGARARSASCRGSSAWNAERAPRSPRSTATRLRGVGDLALPPVPERQRPGLAPLRRPHRGPGGARRLPADARASATGRHYPQPPHLSAAYAWLGYGRGAFPVAEALAAECLSLPIFPGITEQQLAARSSTRSASTSAMA